VEGLKAPLKMDDFGHGQSVLSQSQYHVLLGFKIFGGKQNFGIEGQTFPYPATVEDIAPTILDFLKIGGDPLAATGSSLLQLLESGNVHAYGDPERIRFTETDLRVLPAPGGGVDEDGTARHNSAFFEVDPATARLHIKPAYAPLATAYKERAAFTHNQLLAALPAGPFAHQYVYLDLGAKHGRLLMSRPNDDEPVAQRLWDALVAHYQGELKAPVTTTREDWPRIAAEWTAFSNAAAFNGRRVVASQ
jgi:hypothetical protein